MRLEHTCYRVLDMQKSLDFYINKLGFENKKTVELKQVGQLAIYVAPPGDPTAIELLEDQNRTEPYELGDGYSHIAVEVESVEQTFKDWSARGVQFRGQPFRMAHGAFIAFCEDPDGYVIELVETEGA